MRFSSSDASGRALARIARALWAGWAIVALELGVALAFSFREIATSWELESGLEWLAPTALVASGLVSAVGAFLAWLVAQSELRAVRGLPNISSVHDV